MGDQMWAVSVSSVSSFSFQLIISKYIYIYIYMVIFISFASQNILSKDSSPVICLGADYVKHVNLLSFFFFRFFACGRLLAICRDQKKKIVAAQLSSN